MREPQVYRIHVEGHVNNTLSDWFDGMTLTQMPDGTTILTGTVTDQPALHGLLLKLHNMGLPLIACDRVSDCENGCTSSQKIKSTKERSL